MAEKRTKYSTKSYIDLLKKNNPHNYDYSKIIYKNSSTKIKLKCNDCGFEFESLPLDVLHRQTSCRQCYESIRLRQLGTLKIKPWSNILERARKVHGDTYEYVENSYVSFHKKMTIICKLHGIFEQTVSNHLSGATCLKCSLELRGEKRKLSEKYIFDLGNKIHSEKYKYIEGTYLGKNCKMSIVCPKHGLFEQVAGDHLDGHGCSHCWKLISNGQMEISNFIKSLSIKVIDNYKMKDGKHLDIVCPDVGIAIEYNGLRWHSEEMGKTSEYHRQKTIQAKAEGFRLIHIFEDEYMYEKEKVLNFLKIVLGKATIKFDARKLEVDLNLKWEECSNFLNSIHMQGAGIASIHRFGLRVRQTSELVAVMIFDTRNVNPDEIELIRFCSKGIVRGGFSKLLKVALEKLPCQRIVSFSDTRLSEGDVYLKNGFIKDSEVNPRYWYVKNGTRKHRRSFQRQYLEKELEKFDPALTEKENCKLNGYFRIWDCGKIKWIFDKK